MEWRRGRADLSVELNNEQQMEEKRGALLQVNDLRVSSRNWKQHRKSPHHSDTGSYISHDAPV